MLAQKADNEVFYENADPQIQKVHTLILGVANISL